MSIPALPRHPLNRCALAYATALALLVAPVHAQTPSTPGAGYTTRDQDNLWNLGAVHAAAMRHSRQQWMVATLRRNPDAFVQGNIHRLRSQVTLQFPSDADVAAEDRAEAEALVLRHLAGVLTRESFAPLPPRTAPATDPALPAATPSAPAASAAAAPPVPAAAASVASAEAVAPRVGDAPPRTLPRAPAAPPAAIDTPAGDGGGTTRPWWPFGLAVVLTGGAVALLVRARQTRRPFADTVSALVQDTLQRVRPSKPKVVTVSSAAADMARSVERLAATDRLVQPDSGERAAGPATPTGLQTEAALRLAAARAQIELGRRDAAVAMLRGLLRDTAGGAERRAAEQLLGQLGAA